MKNSPDTPRDRARFRRGRTGRGCSGHRNADSRVERTKQEFCLMECPKLLCQLNQQSMHRRAPQHHADRGRHDAVPDASGSVVGASGSKTPESPAARYPAAFGSCAAERRGRRCPHQDATRAGICGPARCNRSTNRRLGPVRSRRIPRSRGRHRRHRPNQGRPHCGIGLLLPPTT